MERPEFLAQQYPALFDSDREAKLPAWAQAKLSDLRLLLLQEAGSLECALNEIDRLVSRHDN